jgi:hypothetical protein
MESRSVTVSLQAGQGSEKAAEAAELLSDLGPFLAELSSRCGRRWAGVPKIVSTISLSSLYRSESSEAILMNINIAASSAPATIRTTAVAKASNQVNKSGAACAARLINMLQAITRAHLTHSPDNATRGACLRTT